MVRRYTNKGKYASVHNKVNTDFAKWNRDKIQVAIPTSSKHEKTIILYICIRIYEWGAYSFIIRINISKTETA